MSTLRSRYALILALFTAILVLPLVASAEDAGELYRAALRYEAAGDEAGARAAYERVLELDPEHRAARRALGYEDVDGYWLRGDALLRAKGFVHHDGRWMTAKEFADSTRPQRDSAAQQAGETRVLACLADVASEDPVRVSGGQRRLATIPERYRLAPLARALRCEPTSLRVYAATELGRLGNPLAVPALLRLAVVEPDAPVREAVVEALRSIDAPGTIHPLGRALWSRDAQVRARAAEALGRIGDVAAAPYIVGRWEKRSGDFTRVYFTQIDQFAYIQDFDTEVAATSFIADPIVGVLQEGVLQDVRIQATEQVFTRLERVAYANALKRLSGQDHGQDVAAWRRWLDQLEQHQPAGGAGAGDAPGP